MSEKDIPETNAILPLFGLLLWGNTQNLIMEKSYSSAINAIKKDRAGNLVMNWSGNSIKWQEKEPPNIDDMFYESYLNKKIGCLRSCYLWFVDGICPSQTPFETQERSIGQSAMETWRFRSKIIFLRWFCLFLDNMYKVNRCLARYSRRATTTNRPTNWALNNPAWPEPNWPKMPNLVVFGQKILFFTGEIKSFVTHITENPPSPLVHIVFG